jgi:hypothetical protein
MKSFVLLAAGWLLACSGGGAHASSLEPMETPTNLPVAAEQTHLQQSSSQMRGEAISDGDLPLEFKKPSGPRAHNLINLSF